MAFYLFDLSIRHVDIYTIYTCAFKTECVLYFLCKSNRLCCGEKFKNKKKSHALFKGWSRNKRNTDVEN